MKPLNYYFIGAGSWFLAFGIQSVVFAWMVTMVLDETADRVGIAQMAFMLPTMFFMLLGGSLADHYGGKRIAIIGHILASIAPLFLAITVLTGELTYQSVIIFAVIMGTAQALITPARDGLLPLVADGKIQRLVVQASMIQFGIQAFGFLIAAYADELGAATMLLLQFTALQIGMLAYIKLKLPYQRPAPVNQHPFRQISESVLEGFRTVKASPYLRAVAFQNVAMGTFFMGSYIVTIPLLIRELYQGGSVELSWLNAANSFGIVVTILYLMRIGDIHRQGRALLLAQGVGSVALACGGLGLGFYSLLGSIFLWGMCGGFALTMSRTIMQERAPEKQRARIMAFYSFSLLGAIPIGALVSGYLVKWLGASDALITSSILMFIFVIFVSLSSTLWSLDAKPASHPAE
ncbi:MAG: MFS transporter [SAR86 cluster bacterium]|jgi:MFS family permease|tara:strand:+ start:7888 stop:9105 length:1218 start_codon:yes stop_codon:yes gene_type:complete